MGYVLTEEKFYTIQLKQVVAPFHWVDITQELEDYHLDWADKQKIPNMELRVVEHRVIDYVKNGNLAPNRPHRYSARKIYDFLHNCEFLGTLDHNKQCALVDLLEIELEHLYDE